MKQSILFIICSNEMDSFFIPNMQKLNDFIQRLSLEYDVNIACISSVDDFENYESIIVFKYKVINSKRQMGKMCDFISDNKEKMTYDWYVKVRLEIELLSDIDFTTLCPFSINCRARYYTGPKKIKYGCSVGGIGGWSKHKVTQYSEMVSEIIADDQIYIFHKNVINMGGFTYLSKEHEITANHEWDHTEMWKSRNININVVGIHAGFTPLVI